MIHRSILLEVDFQGQSGHHRNFLSHKVLTGQRVTLRYDTPLDPLASISWLDHQ